MTRNTQNKQTSKCTKVPVLITSLDPKEFMDSLSLSDLGIAHHRLLEKVHILKEETVKSLPFYDDFKK